MGNGNGEGERLGDVDNIWIGNRFDIENIIELSIVLYYNDGIEYRESLNNKPENKATKRQERPTSNITTILISNPKELLDNRWLIKKTNIHNIKYI